jgi:hypothetical protein
VQQGIGTLIQKTALNSVSVMLSIDQGFKFMRDIFHSDMAIIYKLDSGSIENIPSL